MSVIDEIILNGTAYDIGGSGGEGGGGISSAAAGLLKNILTAGVYTSDQTTNITNLYNLLIAGGGGGGATTYFISQNLTNVTSDYTSASIREGRSLTIHLTANSGYIINTVTVTMGGSDITTTAYNNGTISISSVTGDIVVTATATAGPYEPVYTYEYGSVPAVEDGSYTVYTQPMTTVVANCEEITASSQKLTFTWDSNTFTKMKCYLFLYTDGQYMGRCNTAQVNGEILNPQWSTTDYQNNNIESGFSIVIPPDSRLMFSVSRGDGGESHDGTITSNSTFCVWVAGGAITISAQDYTS